MPESCIIPAEACSAAKAVFARNVNAKSKNDPRSYRMSSDRLKKIRFKPKYNVQKAIIDLKSMFNANLLKNDKKFYSVNWLKEKIRKNEIN